MRMCLAYRQQISKVTEDNPNPAPGYVLNELAQATYKSVEVCQELQKLLFKKLDKGHVQVTIKALKALRFLCQKGNPRFRKELQRNTAPIRQCISFRGTPDPLHGDSLNRQVRELAQEVMTVAFAELPTDNEGSFQPASSMSSSSSSAIASAGAGPRKMEGFANPEFTPLLFHMFSSHTHHTSSHLLLIRW
eukprot:c7332_g1_i1.p1 GENE.c7332_g1_i1~~c7332_g1_i1.p1  ORF type:complete len:191 (-),score=36.73 c7332_g1_i1:327-899(-)